MMVETTPHRKPQIQDVTAIATKNNGELTGRSTTSQIASVTLSAKAIRPIVVSTRRHRLLFRNLQSSEIVLVGSRNIFPGSIASRGEVAECKMKPVLEE